MGGRVGSTTRDSLRVRSFEAHQKKLIVASTGATWKKEKLLTQTCRSPRNAIMKSSKETICSSTSQKTQTTSPFRYTGPIKIRHINLRRLKCVDLPDGQLIGLGLTFKYFILSLKLLRETAEKRGGGNSAKAGPKPGWERRRAPLQPEWFNWKPPFQVSGRRSFQDHSSDAERRFHKINQQGVIKE